MSMARKAVDSTLGRILNYTTEIIISLILLVTICIPLAFTIPMWFENVFFNVPRTNLSINPALWWGLDGAFWATLLLGLVSLTLGYLYIIKIKPGDVSVTEEDEDDDEEEELSEDIADDDISSKEIVEDAVDDIPLEDQEEEEEYLMDAIEEEIEEESEED